MRIEIAWGDPARNTAERMEVELVAPPPEGSIVVYRDGEDVIMFKVETLFFYTAKGFTTRPTVVAKCERLGKAKPLPLGLKS